MFIFLASTFLNILLMENEFIEMYLPKNYWAIFIESPDFYLRNKFTQILYEQKVKFLYSFYSTSGSLILLLNLYLIFRFLYL